MVRVSSASCLLATLGACSFDTSGLAPNGGHGDAAIHGDAVGAADARPDARPDADPPDATPPCPPGYLKDLTTGSWYRGSSADLEWLAAEQDCEADGAHLVVIVNDPENGEIHAMMTSATWIGASDRVNEGKFLSVTGGNLPYENWGGGEPNNSWGTEDCVQMLGDGRWNDSDCAGKLPYVCECDGQAADPSAY